jgi:hypothetical protein
MNRPFFIRLTKKGSKAAYRENLANYEGTTLTTKELN